MYDYNSKSLDNQTILKKRIDMSDFEKDHFPEDKLGYEYDSEVNTEATMKQGKKLLQMIRKKLKFFGISESHKHEMAASMYRIVTDTIVKKKSYEKVAKHEDDASFILNETSFNDF